MVLCIYTIKKHILSAREIRIGGVHVSNVIVIIKREDGALVRNYI